MTDYQAGIITGILGFFIFKLVVEYTYMQVYYFMESRGMVDDEDRQTMEYLKSKYDSKP